MNTEPKLEHRKEQPYVAVRAQVGIPFGELLGGLWGEANAFLASKGLTPSGPPFIRYLTTDMDKKLDIEVGFPVAKVWMEMTASQQVFFPKGSMLCSYILVITKTLWL